MKPTQAFLMAAGAALAALMLTLGKYRSMLPEEAAGSDGSGTYSDLAQPKAVGHERSAESVIPSSMAGGSVVTGSQSPLPIPEPGIRYVPLALQNLPDGWRDDLAAKLAALHETGSMSRGKLTHEFLSMDYMAENLRKHGLGKLHTQLAISPTDLQAVLGPAFQLLGADVQAKQVLDRGFSGFFQVLGNASTDVLVELSERQVDVPGGDGLVIAPEFNNTQVGASPATIESLSDERGAPVRNLQWATGDRTFHLSTKGLSTAEVLLLAQSVASRFTQMPFEGWRKPYALDVENPLHRISRPGLEQGAAAKAR
ncbi:hypothetical protein [Ramlibacter rhizophilus]|uniref:Uncharacterized protein n=1 Tax=Ramlibacter rhizophilus TaxID=1781167 RepID=A0A4Z0C0B3_9BURK|nr:hypothetical protein [Ramlibacter rhizophilus]TFZ04372.1 hypothetical protein EZ242_01030 [Ramlibacter rhizophilus]